MDWYCGEKFRFLEGSNVGLCFYQVFIVGALDYLIFACGIIYFFVRLKWYRNFNGRKMLEQTLSAQIVVLVKCFLNLVIAFSWVWRRIDIDSVETPYPLRKIVYDMLHMSTWFILLMMIYLEWSRSIGHHFFIRCSWIFSAVLKTYEYFLLYNFYEGRFGQVLVGELVVLFFHWILAILGIVGIFPNFAKYVEADISLAEKWEIPGKDDDNGPPIGQAMGLLWKHTIHRESAAWVVLGICTSLLRGYLFQLLFHYFGLLFQSSTANDLSELLNSILVLFLWFTGYAAFGGVETFFWGIASERIVNGPLGLRNTLFKNMLAQEVAYHDQLGSGQLVARFAADAEKVKSAFDMVIPRSFGAISMVAFGLYYLFEINWRISVYMLCIVPINHAITYFQTEIFALIENENMEKVASMSAQVQDVFSKIPTIMIYCKRNTENFRFHQILDEIYSTLRIKALLNGLFLIFTEYLSWITSLLGIFLAIDFLTDTKGNYGIRYGNFTIYCLYSINVVKAIVMMLKIVPVLGSVIGSMAQVLSMIERSPKAPEEYEGVGELKELKVTEGAITFEDVRFTYPVKKDPTKDNSEALSKISFTVKSNTKVAIVGDSGAGKSTVMQLIARFYDPSHGKVYIDNQNIGECNTSSIRSNMAMVSQDSDIFSATILENILYSHPHCESVSPKQIQSMIRAIERSDPLPPDQEKILTKVTNAIKDANATDFIQGPTDLLKELGEGGKGLSGGQKQRLTIARALFKNPKILLLDEVTSALDPLSEEHVQKALDKLTQNRTVIVVAHRLHTIQNSDLIIVLEKGRILAQGKHDQLMKNSPRYKLMVEATEKKTKKIEEPKPEQEEIPPEFLNTLRKVYSKVELSSKLSQYKTQLLDLVPELAIPIPKPKKLEESDSENDRFKSYTYSGLELSDVLLDDE